jgi:hypothetical protein
MNENYIHDRTRLSLKLHRLVSILHDYKRVFTDNYLKITSICQHVTNYAYRGGEIPNVRNLYPFSVYLVNETEQVRHL